MPYDQDPALPRRTMSNLDAIEADEAYYRRLGMQTPANKLDAAIIEMKLTPGPR